jgi:PAS domain S-box-containing protein
VTALLLAASATEQRLSRAQERQVQEAYQALIARSPIAITGTDRQGRLTIWSRAAERLFGWSAAEAQGRGFPELLPSSDEEQRQLRERVLAGGSVTAFETVLRDREGRSLEVLLHAWPLYGPDGEPAGSMAAVQDITERKESERQQRAIYRIAVAAQATPSLQALYAAIHAIVAELMPAGNLFIALHDPATETISFPYFVNEQEERPAPRRLRGGLTEYVFRTGRPLRAGREQLAALITAGEVELIGVAPVDWMGVPLRAGDRRIGVLAVQSFAEGVHYTERQLGLLEFVSAQVGMAIERKRAEEALRASEAEFRALFAAMRDLIMVLDRDGRCLRIAPTSGELLDRPAAEIVGRALGEVLPGEAARRSLSAVRRALARGGPTALECIWTRRGEERWFQAVASPMTEDTVIFVARDVTEQRRAEEALRQRENELRQATKMEAVGRLAGGVAHDFNNLLTAVLGHAELALTRVPLPEALGDDLRQIRAAGSRAAGLTQQLLAFSRSQVLEPRIVELNDVITGLLKILRRTIGEDIELVTRLTAALDPVRADPVQLEQVLLNLIVNARDAMPQGGRLTIETSGIQLAGSPGVRIAVSDTGIGMSEEVLAHLFEPFFTTKEQGKGTGLGLATAYGIVQQSGGEISVRSEPGVGTTFHVDLPRADADAVADQETPVNGAPRPGWETLLLVEDDDAVRYLTRQVLELQGYHVLAAPGGEAALELSRRFEGPIHLLLTDVVMPQMSGPRLADLLTRQRPDLQVIYMSGYAAHEREHGTAAEAAFLQKPFTPDQLVRRIQAVFDGLARAAPPAPG